MNRFERAMWALALVVVVVVAVTVAAALARPLVDQLVSVWPW